MEGLTPAAKFVPSSSAQGSQNVDAARGSEQKVQSAQTSDLLEEQRVNPVEKAEANDATQENALARVEKALSEAFGERYTKLSLEVEKHEESGRFVYKAVDKETGRVEAQFPSEDMLKIFSSIEGRDGNFLDDKA